MRVQEQVGRILEGERFLDGLDAHHLAEFGFEPEPRRRREHRLGTVQLREIAAREHLESDHAAVAEVDDRLVVRHHGLLVHQAVEEHQNDRLVQNVFMRGRHAVLDRLPHDAKRDVGELDQVLGIDHDRFDGALAVDERAVGAAAIVEHEAGPGIDQLGMNARDALARQAERGVGSPAYLEWVGVDRDIAKRTVGIGPAGEEPHRLSRSRRTRIPAGSRLRGHEDFTAFRLVEHGVVHRPLREVRPRARPCAAPG